MTIPSFCPAADTPLGLTVRESGTALYSRQDVESDKLGTLQKGETLIPVGEAVGQETWYMVKTQGGLFGWVRAAVAACTSIRAAITPWFRQPKYAYGTLVELEQA